MHSVILGLSHYLYCSGSIKSMAGCLSKCLMLYANDMPKYNHTDTNYLLPPYIAPGSTTVCADLPTRTASHIA